VHVPLPVQPGDYRAITAIGVISVGGAPASVYDDLLAILAPGDLLAFSLNDQSMAMDEYGGRLQRSVSDGEAVASGLRPTVRTCRRMAKIQARPYMCLNGSEPGRA
jgi:hypothetical protein